MADFSIETQRQSNIVVLTVIGDLDLSTVPALRTSSTEVLADPEAAGLVLDFHGLTFLDSTGLGCLVELRQLATTTGKSFALSSLRPESARVLELGGLGDFFDLVAPLEGGD